jgi:serine/threonine protein kinase
MAAILLEHPAAERLAAFVTGRLSDDESVQIENHLSDCDTCRSVLESLPEGSLDFVLRFPPPPADLSPQATAGFRTPNDLGAAGDAATLPPRADADSLSADGASALPLQARLPAALVDHPRYIVLDLLGIGGMGAVYKARHRMMDRVVALKVMRKRFVANPKAVERFCREVRAAARLTHPNIVTAYDAEQAGDTHLLVMELIEGVSLDRVIAEHGPLTVDKAIDYIRQGALGLQHAYERGMVHRDIKPQNLMLTPDGQIKILDFGLARFVHESSVSDTPDETNSASSTADRTPAATLTQAGTVMGTPDFMAPEQASNSSAADIRADIYSLGCTLYYLLAGKAPFDAETRLGKLKAHQERTPVSLSELCMDVPAELIQVIDRMMAKNPQNRYVTPGEAARALERCRQLPQQSRWTASEAWGRRGSETQGLRATSPISPFSKPVPAHRVTDDCSPDASTGEELARCLHEGSWYWELAPIPEKRREDASKSWFPQFLLRLGSGQRKYFVKLALSSLLIFAAGVLCWLILFRTSTILLEPVNAGFRVEAPMAFPPPSSRTSDLGVTVFRFEKEHKGAIYSIVYFEITEAQRKWTDSGMFRSFYESVITGYRGAKLLWVQQQEPLDGYPGLEWLLRLAEGRTIRMRAFRGKDRFFALAVELPKGVEDPPEARRFFESFHINT